MNNVLKRNILIVLLLSFILSSIPCVTFAETGSKAEENARAWLAQIAERPEVHLIEWEDNEVMYSALFLPLPVEIVNGFGFYGGGNQRLSYKDEKGKTQQVDISIRIDGENGSQEILLRQTGNRLEGYPGVMMEIDKSWIDIPELGGLEITLTLPDGTEVSKYYDDTPDIETHFVTDNAFLEFLKTLVNILFKPVEEVLKLLEKILNGLILACADNILASVCKAVGESVTIDSVVLGQTQKISIDFWGATSGTSSVASMLKNVVNYWYGIFRSIALIVYFIVLLIIGIKVLIASTGTAKAKYKDLIKDWIVGIALLLLFPHAMKMIVDVNDTLVKYVASTGYTPTEGIKISAEDSPSKFGEDDFVSAATGSESEPGRKNTMMYVRFLAGKQGRIPLAIVYCIMIFQLIVILCVYYKRVFMLAFLITIFPLVAMTYTVDKLRRRAYKNKCFQHLAKGVLRECACSNFSCNYICDNC